MTTWSVIAGALFSNSRVLAPQELIGSLETIHREVDRFQFAFDAGSTNDSTNDLPNRYMLFLVSQAIWRESEDQNVLAN